jgi:hypothetical protein
VVALLVIAALSALIVAYSLAAMSESRLAKASMGGIHGHLAAEAGVNLRAAEIRQLYQQWERPIGTPPATPAVGQLPCTVSTGLGTGDFGCQTYALSERSAVTYVREEPGNPRSIVIPAGDLYASLFADEWRYTVSSTAVNRDGFPEAILEMRWKTRNVPIFQFFALYDRDLELYPGPDMTIHGPIHSNEDIYFDASNGLQIFDSEITIAEKLYSGRKYSSSKCNAGSVSVDANALPSTPMAPPSGANDNLVAINTCTSGNRRQIPQSALDSAGLSDSVQTGVDAVQIPPVEDFDPPTPLSAGTSATDPGLYWEKADLRVVLVLRDLNGDGDEKDLAVNNVSESAHGVDFDFDGDTADTVNNQREMWIEIRNPDNSIDVAATRRATDPRTCPGMYNESPASSAGNKPVGAPGGTHPAGVWYTFENTYGTNSWRWKNASNAPRKHGLMDHREEDWFSNDVWIKMLEVDLGRFFDCLHDADVDGADILFAGRSLDDETNGGLVFYFTVDGPDSSAARSNYGVRIRNGSFLGSTISGAPRPRGLTMVTDQAAYLYGDYNLDPNWIPSAIIGDSVNVLSNAWVDDNYSTQDNKNNRGASETTQQIAFLSGTTEAGDDNGVESGALNNYPRFLEYWGNSTPLNLQTSFVSLFSPRHNQSGFSTRWYQPPARNWDFDQRFRVNGQLPPMSPRFTYSRQELMTRNFEW